MEYPKTAEEARRLKSEYSNSKRIARMHLNHGAGPAGRKCKDCEHLLLHRYGRTVFKCLQFGTSRSAVTDWRESWPACGKFEVKRSAGR
jgi:hypothetical protein